MLNIKETPNKNYKYLFVAELVDGTFFKQTPDDKSLLDENRNCYYDLLQLISKGGKEKTIRRFSLVGENNTITVDLGNGVFYVNGLAVLLESEQLPCYPDKFDLIWYHQVDRDTTVTYNTKTGKAISKKDGGEFRMYFIGWQCNIKGKNYQQKIAVS